MPLLRVSWPREAVDPGEQELETKAVKSSNETGRFTSQRPFIVEVGKHFLLSQHSWARPLATFGTLPVVMMLSGPNMCEVPGPALMPVLLLRPDMKYVLQGSRQEGRGPGGRQKRASAVVAS